MRWASGLKEGAKHVTPEHCVKWLHEIYAWAIKQPGCSRIFLEPDRILNCDESGFQMDGGKKGKTWVIAPRHRKQVNRLTSGNTDSITVMFTVNAAGTTFPPFIVVKGVGNANHEPREGTIEKHHITLNRFYCTPNGWMEGNAFSRYLTCLSEWLDHFHMKKPILLILDGASSHYHVEGTIEAREKGILLFCLPAHTTQDLQVLDVAFLGPLKRRFAEMAQQFRYQHFAENLQVTKKNFPMLLKHCLDTEVASASGIRNGFEKVGIYPFNPSKPWDLTERFALDETDVETRALMDELRVDYIKDGDDAFEEIELVPVEQYKLPDIAKIENDPNSNIAYTYQQFRGKDGSKWKGKRVKSVTETLLVEVNMLEL